MMRELQQIQQRTLAARVRTGDRAIGTQVKDGKFQIVRCTYPNGVNSKVEPISDWLEVPQLLEALDRIGA